MPAKKTYSGVINGFKIIRDIGTFNSGNHYVIYECHSCFIHKEAEIFNLQQMKSCGCLSRTNIPRRLRSIYTGIKSRCYNKNHMTYKSYGGRGILMCDEWLNDNKVFFKWALYNGYKDNLSIDRIDNDKGYSPDNCRWISLSEQQKNRRNYKMGKLSPCQVLEIYHSNLSGPKIAKLYGVSHRTVYLIKKKQIWLDITKGV